ncbi:uncharacterized protein LAESUDRAFT_413997 [Laetiporus sulphureus 93-53]|uniref:BHLH domain-containing protein n=1 Tax=Laetiporus sulphureus 93-53 TaxID=1314785 RepID=A0A165C7W6_9APHY|nr:uncharacterized protein LAESUDRAFT_413997 [Laetiporus sulphureus 93-53]KZT02354.1 hypothetical protein LAESUDRAFT_413997 [Laetiporus sulphureus 93-53]
MALPITIPSSPTGAASPTSTDGSNGPRTPASPSNPTTLSLPPPAEGSSASPPPAANNGPANGAPNKRKASRRANTAERRATHNAVERQRRETLNGRFLDLAALLPNLSQIRRPSKSSIVNSSIAHIHASRRHRMLAARELRLIKLEADALRRELNEWRDRSGLPRVEEPVRGEAFQMIMSGEVELLSAVPVEEEDGDEYGDDEFVGNGHSNGATRGNIADDIDQEMRGPMAHTAAVPLLKNSPDVGSFSHGTPTSDLRLQTMLSRSGAPGNGTPMIVSSPTGVSFENPAMVSMYEPHHGPLGAGQFAGQFFGNHGIGNAGEDKINWHYASLSGPGQQPAAWVVRTAAQRTGTTRPLKAPRRACGGSAAGAWAAHRVDSARRVRAATICY